MSSDSSPHRLTPLQRAVLRAFFERETGFFLTGGAALVEYHFGHRFTDDLDLFTPDEAAFERGSFALRAAAKAVGAELTVRQDAPGFRRFLIRREGEAVLVDLVLDPVPRIHAAIEIEDGIRVDPPAEILVNKLTTLVSRAEIRDLVDVMRLEEAGLDLREALKGALIKDGGCTPASLAWVLSQVAVPESVQLPGDVQPSALRAYLEGLIQRLLQWASPAV